MDKTVYIIIGCDTDPDRVAFLDNLPEDTLSWRGMLEGIPYTKENLKDLLDADGHPPVFSWCLRVDEQVKKVHGDYDYILKTHRDFLLGLEEAGDELSWHPHFFKFDETTKKWYQEFRDQAWQTDMLKKAYAAYQNVLPGRARSVRMGWDYHNNNTFATLQELGVEVDFSGIPGLCIKPKNENVRSVNFFDWSLSPNRPYYPAKSDYRIEAQGNEEAFTLLESPNYVSKSFIWGMISGLVLAKKMKNISQVFRALANPTYWITITGTNKYFTPLAKQLARDLNRLDKIFFVTYFHPDELIKNNNPLYSFENLRENLKTLLTVADQKGAKVKFIKASDIKKYL